MHQAHLAGLEAGAGVGIEQAALLVARTHDGIRRFHAAEDRGLLAVGQVPFAQALGEFFRIGHPLLNLGLAQSERTEIDRLAHVAGGGGGGLLLGIPRAPATSSVLRPALRAAFSSLP